MEWKSVVGYEGIYEVSDNGDVRVLDREYVDDIGRHTIKRGHLLNPRKTLLGYKRVTLCKDKHPKSYAVHRLVAQAFIPNPNNYPCVNHKDEDKLNNKVSNLEWCTSEYNANYGTRNERMKETLRSRERNCKAIIAIRVDDGGTEYYRSAREAERVLGYPHTGISNMLKGRAKTAFGRIWKYAGELL